MDAYKQQLTSLVQVIHGKGDFSTKLVSLVDREPGTLLTKIEGITVSSRRAYNSLQIDKDSDVELNSDLVYCNHSCKPSVIFDTRNMEVRVAKDRPLRRGDEVTFFYPSTEWDMDQVFTCGCGAAWCVGEVKGAKFLDADVLERHWLNQHVKKLLIERDPSFQRRGLVGPTST